MKGFKPTGYGPSSGFKFPQQMGFTGSTGAVTAVNPYLRRKHFADGGYVRQDSPRMKSEMVGDTGSAAVRRTKPSTNVDQEYGGRSPLRPGFKNGGKIQPKMKSAKRGAVLRKSDGGKARAPEYPKPSYLSAVKDRVKEMLTSEAKSSTGMAKKAADKLSGRQKQIEDAINYSRGGKARSRC